MGSNLDTQALSTVAQRFSTVLRLEITIILVVLVAVLESNVTCKCNLRKRDHSNLFVGFLSRMHGPPQFDVSNPKVHELLRYLS